MIRCIHNGIVINGMSKSDTKGAVLIENGIIADVFTEARFEQKTFGPDVEVIDAKGNVIKISTYSIAKKFGTTVNELVGMSDFTYQY